MIKLLIVLVVISIVAGALGFTGIARGAASAAKIIFFILLVIILALVLLGAWHRRFLLTRDLYRSLRRAFPWNFRSLLRLP